MRLGILSVTHDELLRTQLSVKLLREAGAEALIHCGDLASSPIVEAIAVLPSWFVFGNHDADSVPSLRAAAEQFGSKCLGWGGVVELCNRRIGVVHGHMTSDLRRVLTEIPEFLFSGHSHFPSHIKDGPVRKINPGAIYRADEFTVAILDLATDELQILKVVE